MLRTLRRAAPLLVVLLPACSSAETPLPSENVGTAASAITASQAISRAEEWVNAQLLYCQSPNHASDAIDPACPAICNRTDNPAWDPYRSDCSGLISYAWGLPPPGRTTYGFAPFATDITHVIDAASLAPGDAVNNSDHVMLFKSWVTPGQSATFIEEPGCSSNPNYAHEFTSNVSISGSSIHVAYNGMTFSAIQFDALGPDCTDQCKEPSRVGIAVAPTGQGYWIADGDGNVYANGSAPFFGDVAGAPLNEPVVAIARTPSGNGYWLAAADGGVFAFGDAGFHGSAGGIALKEPIVGMAPTPDGGGYWLVAGDGGVFAYGNAGFFGSTGSIDLNKPVVGMAATPSGQGYWVVAADGGIFAFGDAGFFGSTGGMMLNKPIVGMASTPSGKGYWLVASDGGIFAFGDAAFFGSAGGVMLAAPATALGATADAQGYWILGADGGIFTYGDATYQGNATADGCDGATPKQCVVGANGCRVDQDAAACPAGQTCANRTCQTTCSDVCMAGTTQCSGAEVQTCGRWGTDPCSTWAAPVPCPAGQGCMNGACVPVCNGDCNAGGAGGASGAAGASGSTSTAGAGGKSSGGAGGTTGGSGTTGSAGFPSAAGHAGATSAGGHATSGAGGMTASAGGSGATSSGGAASPNVVVTPRADDGSSGGCSVAERRGGSVFAFAWAALAMIAGARRRRRGF